MYSILQKCEVFYIIQTFADSNEPHFYLILYNDPLLYSMRLVIIIEANCHSFHLHSHTFLRIITLEKQLNTKVYIPNSLYIFSQYNHDNYFSAFLYWFAWIYNP